ncbi:MAG TPA: hydroxysqualene dehydroxylase HpnE [Blastocatellia bacterium]|nr:hydroxysqualene dehydroxylase HpnE [Blastocatellia bacterium]
MKGISTGDKFRLLNVGRALRKKSDSNGNHQTVSEWLRGLGQSERIRQRFWYPMAVATLNESPDQASAGMMKKVLEIAFGGDRAGASIGISRVGLSDLYTTGARDYIEARGGQVRAGAPVRRLVIDKNRVTAVELKDGEIVAADAFISAVPPAAFLDLLPADLRAREFAPVAALTSSPIVSINLWFDRPVIDREFVGLLGTRIQWLFNKDAIFANGKQTNQIAIVISAARDCVDWNKSALVEMAVAELAELIPESRSAKLLHSVIVKEREATISHTVESDYLRPGARTPLANLILAGDWTATGLPATIESAVMSGNLAAEIIDGNSHRGHREHRKSF